MSEDTAQGFDGWPMKRVALPEIHADTPHTAALVEAAGWAVGATGLAGCGSAAIVALDWRQQVPSGDFTALMAADCAFLVLVSIDTIDQADALLLGHTVRFVFGSSAPLMAAELSELAAMVRAPFAADPSSDERVRLQALAHELARLAEQLGAISGEDDASGHAVGDRSLEYQAEAMEARGAAAPPSAQRIRHLIAMRRLRERFFSGDLFADPAWDIMLDLSAARLEGKSVSVSSLCIAAAVPPTTALRWIRMMTDQGLLERRADPVDARRMFVDLSDAAFESLCGWFGLVELRGGLGL